MEANPGDNCWRELGAGTQLGAGKKDFSDHVMLSKPKLWENLKYVVEDFGSTKQIQVFNRMRLSIYRYVQYYRQRDAIFALTWVQILVYRKERYLFS